MIILVFTALVLLIVVLLAVSRYMIEVTEYTVSSPRLPESFDGFRIAQVSDLHGTEFGKDNEKLIEKLQQSRPDIIAITGDMADENTDMEVIERFLSAAVKIAPVYYVSGNHEWSCGCLGELRELFEKYGVTYLSNDYELLSRGEDSIVLAGVEDPNGRADMSTPGEFVQQLNADFPDSYIVMLGHRNYWIERYPDLEVDIILCGHAHGGIVRVPFFGGLLGAGFKLFPEHVDGVNTSGRYSMIVSRGLGNSVPVPRFLNRPELVVVTLKKD